MLASQVPLSELWLHTFASLGIVSRESKREHAKLTDNGPIKSLPVEVSTYKPCTFISVLPFLFSYPPCE